MSKVLIEELPFHEHVVQTYRDGDKKLFVVSDRNGNQLHECKTLAEAIHVAKSRIAVSQLHDYALDPAVVLADVLAAPQDDSDESDSEGDD